MTARDLPTCVPRALHDLPACVYGVGVVANGKRDKAPRHPRTLCRVSTSTPGGWVEFHEAAAAAAARPDTIGGVGVLMQSGVVGIDIDNAFLPDGPLKAGPRAILDALGTWAEVSMSGKGIHAFCKGIIPEDFTTRTAVGSDGETFGLEVYGGNAPRYLALTGNHFEGTPTDMVALSDAAMTELQRYKTNSGSTTKTDPCARPDAVSIATLPDIETLCDRMGSSYAGAVFLRTGEAADRSAGLHDAALGLRWAGLEAAQIQAVLENNQYAWSVAMSHRGDNEARARDYLWRHHASKVADRTTYLEVAGSFDDLTDGANTDPKATRVGGLQWFTGGQFCADKSRLKWLVPGVLPEAEIGAVFGASGSGKTFMVLSLAAAIATGGKFYGIEATQAPVAIVALEGVHGFRDRLRAYSARHGAVPNLHIATGALNLREPGSEHEIVPHLRGIGPRGLLVVDTLAQATPGADENSGKDMGAVVARLKAIHRRTGWTVLLVAHSGKDTRAGLRGWSGIKAALDCEIEVTKTHTYRAATITKLKDGAGEGHEFRFDIETVVLEGDRTGGVLVERGTTQFESGTPAPAKPQGKNQEIVFAAFEAHQHAGEITRVDLMRHAIEALAGTGKPRDRAREALEGLCRTGAALVVDGDIVRRASGSSTGRGGAMAWG